ncbi:MAG: two-component system, NarL family, nitrate/nitrite sensor histidine kinase NarX, partial [Pseudomonadota bacterium]|nr:two-component system, NarL family, nitrate/nitrite sensor histidine kinase NarX [Pseudomonadota bacterium]
SIRGIEQVENSLDEAYTDLRELIAHCRTPINTQGLIQAVEKMISRFRKETGIHVLLQKEWDTELPPNIEMHVFRIVQEAMNNIRKHSHAHNVRLMFRCDTQGNHHVLVENDGTGFETPNPSNHPGKHLGLTIMQERAAHIGGTLRIESDPDEGTRIELHFKYNNESRYNPLQHLAVISK